MIELDQAIAEAGRCLLCHEPPCSKACPAGTDPGAFLRKLRMRNVTGAIRTIKTNNILGGVCGALCPVDRLCEQACCASGIERPVRIGSVQECLVAHGRSIGFQPLRPVAQTRGRVAMVGGGPAGLACAAELAGRGFAVTVFESRERAGGVLAWGVPAWRLPADQLEAELDDVRLLGVELRCASPVQGPGAVEALLREGFEAVFLGPGCWEPVSLCAAPVRGVMSYVELLSAMREGHLDELSASIRGRRVAVLGGGSVAMDCAQTARRLGASEVSVVYRRSYAQMPAEEDERLEALRDGIHFELLQRPESYEVGPTGALAGVRLVRTRLGGVDASGRPEPVDVPGSGWLLEVDVAVEALGSRPAAGLAPSYPSVGVGRSGQVLVDENGMTSVPGLFAGGDIVAGPSLVVTAIRDGKKAAAGIERYLTGRGMA